MEDFQSGSKGKGVVNTLFHLENKPAEKDEQRAQKKSDAQWAEEMHVKRTFLNCHREILGENFLALMEKRKVDLGLDAKQT